MNPIKVDWTEATAEFASKLRRAFTSRGADGFTPHKRTPLNALILHCEKNGDPIKLGLPSLVQKVPEFETTSDFVVDEEGDVYEALIAIGAPLNSEAFGGANQPRFLRLVLEGVMAYYRADERWAEARRIVKRHIMHESFKTARQKIKVAFDVPSELWKEIGLRINNRTEAAVLSALEADVKKLCEKGGEALKAELDVLKAKVLAMKEAMAHEADPRFVVLAIGEQAKEALEFAIGGDFEAALIVLLVADQ